MNPATRTAVRVALSGAALARLPRPDFGRHARTVRGMVGVMSIRPTVNRISQLVVKNDR